MQKKMFWRDAGVNALDHFEKYDWWIIEKHLKHLEHIDYRKHMKYSEHMNTGNTWNTSRTWNTWNTRTHETHKSLETRWLISHQIFILIKSHNELDSEGILLKIFYF